jgi:hypothetical protein
MASKLATLKTGLVRYLPGNLVLNGVLSSETLIRKPLLLSMRKASRAFDFNKFFKINKMVARNMNEISTDLYSQYIANLQEGYVVSGTVADQKSVKDARAAKVLRKYVQLLKQYFMEVHDNKMAKNIPASSAMH